MRTGWEMRTERVNRVSGVRGECPERVPSA